METILNQRWRQAIGVNQISAYSQKRTLGQVLENPNPSKFGGPEIFLKSVQMSLN